MTARVFLFSGYHTGSHRAWAEGYGNSSGHDVHLVTMPGSFWKWRLDGGFVTLAERAVSLAEQVGVPDVILATSMVDLAGLTGLLRSHFGAVPAAIYMHENQVTYPNLGRGPVAQRQRLTSWTSLLAADAIAFNSRFHRDEFFDALPGFLGSFPDEGQTHLIPAARDRTMVLPVGASLQGLHTGPKTEPPLILWNHRWDADKRPQAFLDLMGRLAATGAEFAVALAGERFVDQRSDLDGAVAALGDRVVLDGYLSRDEYEAVLAAASVVVSTAAQEFFGVSVVEAIRAGAFPVLPDRLVYPERIPEPLADRCLYGEHADAVSLLVRAISDELYREETVAMLAGVTDGFDWAQVAPAYDAWLGSITPS